MLPLQKGHFLCLVAAFKGEISKCIIKNWVFACTLLLFGVLFCQDYRFVGFMRVFWKSFIEFLKLTKLLGCFVCPRNSVSQSVSNSYQVTKAKSKKAFRKEVNLSAGGTENVSKATHFTHLLAKKE